MSKDKDSAKKFDLDQRLEDFGVRIAKIVEALPSTKLGNYFGNQLVRSGFSPSLNYSEAQSAESRRDFVHKLKTVLKELRETLKSLKLIYRLNLAAEEKIAPVIKGSNELISIFVKSVETAQKGKTNR